MAAARKPPSERTQRTRELLEHLDAAIVALAEVGSAPAVFEHSLCEGMVTSMQQAEVRLKAVQALGKNEQKEMPWLEADVPPELLEYLDQDVPLHPDMFLVEQLKDASKAHQKDVIMEYQLDKLARGVREGAN